MKIESVIKILFLFAIIGCEANPNNFKYETRLLEGLKIGKELNKPIFIYFTGYGCLGYDEFKNDLITTKSIQNKLNEEFVSVVLYVDDREEIGKSDTLSLDRIGLSKKGQEKIKKSKNIGNVYSNEQQKIII